MYIIHPGAIMTSVLFICKEGEDYRIVEYGYFRRFSGLFNSARLVNEMLQDNGISSDIEIARDNNDIDRLVTRHKPDYCIIEAYWVVPEKFEILHKLHPNIKWIIRIHSEVPFWATEGISMDWSLRYLDYDNVYLAPNSSRLFEDLKIALTVKYDRETIDNRVVFLPNYYPSADKKLKREHKIPGVVKVGCFGAIRPLKNQLIQAIAAIDYANKTHQKLEFHINGNRLEGNGEPVIKNIRKLFEHSHKHELVEHAWQPHHLFLETIADMDIGMQVSFTESFNIVTADMVTVGIPVVTSSEISWVSSFFHADPTSVNSIVNKMHKAKFLGKMGVMLNRVLLDCYSEKSVDKWLDFVNGGFC